MPHAVYLTAKYENAGAVKSGGAKWDKLAKKWLVNNPISFQKCIDFVPENTVSPWPERDWQDFSFDQRYQAKQIGCWWDADAKCWYLPNEEDRTNYHARSPTNSDTSS